MPIFSSSKIRLPYGADHDLVNAEYEGDKFKFTHVQKIDDILEDAEMCRTWSDNGWTSGKNMRKIATIPAGEFVNHPEWAFDQKALLKWIKSEEGRPYRTVTKGI